MAFITGLFIAGLMDMSLSEKWTFKKWDDFSTSANKSSPLCINRRDQVIRCCGVCGSIPECTTVVLNNDHCICSSELFPHALQVDDNTSVYVKGPKPCYAPGYIFVNNLCIKVSTDNKTWHEAKLDCENTGGILIILDSPEKHKRIVDMFIRYFDKAARKYFVGASDIEVEGIWKWIKENTSSYMHDATFTEYDSDFPGQGADCGAINLESNGIDDEFCDGLNYYICEVVF